MFIGAVPMPVVNQLLRAVDCSSWREIFVCCSGSFRVDRALKERYPQKAVRGNDVSLVSCALGTLLTGGELAITFKDRLAFIEEREFADYAWRVAAVIVALRLSQFSGKNAYAQGHFEHCRQNFDTYLAKAHEKVLQLQAGVALDEYCAGDFRDHADVAMREGAGIAGFMPTYKGGYERLYRFLEENVDWPRPSFRIWDPKDLPDWLSMVAKSESPYFVVTDHELPGFKAATEYRSQAQPRGVVRLSGGRSGNRSLELDRITDAARRGRLYSSAIRARVRLNVCADQGTRADVARQKIAAWRAPCTALDGVERRRGAGRGGQHEAGQGQKQRAHRRYRRADHGHRARRECPTSGRTGISDVYPRVTGRNEQRLRMQA
jgi:hypothetical protein